EQEADDGSQRVQEPEDDGHATKEDRRLSGVVLHVRVVLPNEQEDDAGHPAKEVGQDRTRLLVHTHSGLVRLLLVALGRILGWLLPGRRVSGGLVGRGGVARRWRARGGVA